MERKEKIPIKVFPLKTAARRHVVLDIVIVYSAAAGPQISGGCEENNTREISVPTTTTTTAEHTPRCRVLLRQEQHSLLIARNGQSDQTRLEIAANFFFILLFLSKCWSSKIGFSFFL